MFSARMPGLNNLNRPFRNLRALCKTVWGPHFEEIPGAVDAVSEGRVLDTTEPLAEGTVTSCLGVREERCYEYIKFISRITRHRQFVLLRYMCWTSKKDGLNYAINGISGNESMSGEQVTYIFLHIAICPELQVNSIFFKYIN